MVRSILLITGNGCSYVRLRCRLILFGGVGIPVTSNVINLSYPSNYIVQECDCYEKIDFFGDVTFGYSV